MLRNKLDSLWEKYEEEKDVVMLVTKSEVEKSKQDEINELQDKIRSLETDAEDLASKESYIKRLEDAKYESEMA